MPDGRYRAISHLRPLHWADGGQWVEIDDTPTSTDGGKTWTTPSTPYNLAWDSETLTLSYESKRGGDVSVRLVALDGAVVPGKIGPPTVDGQSLRAFVAPELEIELRVRPYGVEIFKILYGPTAPRSFTWEVVEGETSNIAINLMETRGRDNLLLTEARKLASGLNARRAVELTHVRSEDDLLVNSGKTTYSVIESFTGKTQVIDPETRARTWVDEVEWPVAIDVTITETIVANDDDGTGGAANWSANFIRTGMAYSTDSHGGFRFQTVNIPQGQILDSAILTINVTFSGGGSGESGTVAGHAVDNAPVWVNYGAYTPKTMPATTATVSYPRPAVGLRTIDVKTICQEIVNRAGWAANNSMRLGFTDVTGMASSYFYAEDYNAASPSPPQLEIIYTGAGAVGTVNDFSLFPKLPFRSEARG